MELRARRRLGGPSLWRPRCRWVADVRANKHRGRVLLGCAHRLTAWQRLTNSGATYCWGARGDGQLGDGTPQVWWAPGAVSGSSFTALAAAGDYAGYTCGLTSAGAAYCWGSNVNGELGNGSTTWSSEPVPVSGNLSFGALAAGGDYTCGLTSTGAAYCWGDNSVGQLGNRSTTSSSIPVAVSGGQSFTALAAAGGVSPPTSRAAPERESKPP